MPDTSFHTITVCDVLFKVSPDVIVQLLGMSFASKPSTTKPTLVEWTHDVSSFASSTSYVDLHDDEGDQLDSGDSFEEDDDFFIHTGKHYTMLNPKNSFAKK